VPPPFRTHDDRGCSPCNSLARFAWRHRASLPAAAPSLGFLAPSTVLALEKSPSQFIAPGHVAARSRIRGSHDFGASTPRHSSGCINAREHCCLPKESAGSSGCLPSHASHPSKTHSSSTAVPPHDGLGPPAVHHIASQSALRKALLIRDRKRRTRMLTPRLSTSELPNGPSRTMDQHRQRAFPLAAAQRPDQRGQAHETLISAPYSTSRWPPLEGADASSRRRCSCRPSSLLLQGCPCLSVGDGRSIVVTSVSLQASNATEVSWMRGDRLAATPPPCPPWWARSSRLGPPRLPRTDALAPAACSWGSDDEPCCLSAAAASRQTGASRRRGALRPFPTLTPEGARGTVRGRILAPTDRCSTDLPFFYRWLSARLDLCFRSVLPPTGSSGPNHRIGPLRSLRGDDTNASLPPQLDFRAFLHRRVRDDLPRFRGRSSASSMGFFSSRPANHPLDRSFQSTPIPRPVLLEPPHE
jgi:hypothetical protein